MDLGAYMEIDTLDKLVQKNGICVPRLRGYRLMKREKPVDYTSFKSSVELEVLEYLCRSHWGRSSGYMYSWEIDAKCRYYMDNWDCRYLPEYDENYKPLAIRWDRLKGKNRRIFKTHVKNAMSRYKKQYEVWNKYCGRDDVLYIHARIGGGNWHTYYDQVVNKPWFLEKVDDGYDCTYCDIYAKLEVTEDV